ncbi:MAG: GFA family protein [Gammaproteobacteria bacterium]|nr:GFA family protein [Gammaproteobacteria bacterium]
MSKNYFAVGQCLCGQVKFTVSSSPVRMGQCHCDDCQKSIGTGHASNAFFKKDDVKIEGKLSQYGSTTDTGSVITRSFCPICGSRLFGESNVINNVLSISAGVLDDNSWFKADAIVYNKRKPQWDFMDETIPTFEEMPPAAVKK